MRADTSNFRTVKCTGGPCDGRPAAVTRDQEVLLFSVGNEPVIQVYRIDHETFTARFIGTRDVKEERVG